jgi:EAL domain-containing protein (putative c-di-GMP-specific phosphodiesterase class I)
MYRAKHGGRDTYCLHDAALTDASRELFGLKNDLHGAVDRNELDLRFLPIVRVSDGVITGIEALIRWNHPEMGQIAPSTFLPLAEESELIVEIGSWAIRRACEQFGEWRCQGLLAEARLTVNLAARQFADPTLAKRIGTLLYENGFEPVALELEITEGTFRTGESLYSIWNELRDLGVRISIDDFGRGHSSLDQLLRFEVDAISGSNTCMRSMSITTSTSSPSRTEVRGSTLARSLISPAIRWRKTSLPIGSVTSTVTRVGAAVMPEGTNSLSWMFSGRTPKRIFRSTYCRTSSARSSGTSTSNPSPLRLMP